MGLLHNTQHMAADVWQYVRGEEGQKETETEKRSLEALKHFALPAQQMPHSVWHSDLWACSIYTLTVSLQGQCYTRTHLVSGLCSSTAVAEMMKLERHIQRQNGNKVYICILYIQWL